MKAHLNSILCATLCIGMLVACSKPAEKTAPAKTEPAKSEPVQADNQGETKKPVAGEKTADKAQKGPVAKATAAAAKTDRLKGPVAKINGVPIDSKLFYEEVDKITSRGAKIPPERLVRIEQNILKRLVEKELIRQEVERSKVNVAAAEIEAAFTEYKKRFQTEEQFQNYLKHGRVTLESIKGRIQEKKSLEKLIEGRGNLAVEEKEAREFYGKNGRFYLEKEGIRASHVLIKLPEKATPDMEKTAMDKVKLIQKEIKAGKDFAELAKKHSEGPSAPKGGDLGFFGKGQMVKAFEEVAFTMKKDQISEPVRTRFGYHIIKMMEKREERKKPFEEVKAQIEDSLRNKKFFQERRSVLDELKKEAKIEKFIADPPPAAAPNRGHAHGPGPGHARPHPHP